MNVPEGTQGRLGRGEEQCGRGTSKRTVHYQNAKRYGNNKVTRRAYASNGARLVGTWGLVGLGPAVGGLGAGCREAAAEVRRPPPRRRPDVTCGPRPPAEDRAARASRRRPHRAPLFSCPDPKVIARSQSQEPVLFSALAHILTPANHIFRFSRGSLWGLC